MTRLTDRQRRRRRALDSRPQRPAPADAPAGRTRPTRGNRGRILALTRLWPSVWLDRLNGLLIDDADPLRPLHELNRAHLTTMVREAMARQSWTHPLVEEWRWRAKDALEFLIRQFQMADLATPAPREVAQTGIDWLSEIAQLDPAPLTRLRCCKLYECVRPWFWDMGDRGHARFCSSGCRLRRHRVSLPVPSFLPPPPDDSEPGPTDDSDPVLLWPRIRRSRDL